MGSPVVHGQRRICDSNGKPFASKAIAAFAIAVRNRFDLANAKNFFQFNYEIKHILQIVYASNMQSAIYDAFYQVMMPQYGANAKECYQARFYSYGLFGLLDEWIKRGFKEQAVQTVDYNPVLVLINR